MVLSATTACCALSLTIFQWRVYSAFRSSSSVMARIMGGMYPFPWTTSSSASFLPGQLLGPVVSRNHSISSPPPSQKEPPSGTYTVTTLERTNVRTMIADCFVKVGGRGRRRAWGCWLSLVVGVRLSLSYVVKLHRGGDDGVVVTGLCQDPQ